MCFSNASASFFAILRQLVYAKASAHGAGGGTSKLLAFSRAIRAFHKRPGMSKQHHTPAILHPILGPIQCLLLIPPPPRSSTKTLPRLIPHAILRISAAFAKVPGFKSRSSDRLIEVSHLEVYSDSAYQAEAGFARKRDENDRAMASEAIHFSNTGKPTTAECRGEQNSPAPAPTQS